MHLGVVGIGIMGKALTERLLANGHEVTVFNRNRAKVEPLLKAGAKWANSPAEASMASEVLFSAVTDPAAVDGITLGAEGIVAGLPAQSVHCDISTVTPVSAQRIADMYSKVGKRFVQAPVLGNRKHIASGKLLVFAGGASDDIDICELALKGVTERIRRMESAQQAMAAKLACNMVIAHTIVGLGQAMAFAQAGGVSQELLLEILGESAMGCAMFSSKGQMIVSGAYSEPNFTVRNMLKDIHLISQTQPDQPVHNAVQKLFEKALEDGYGDEDYSAVVKELGI